MKEDDVIKKFLLKIQGDEKMMVQLIRLVLIAQEGTEEDVSDYLEARGSVRRFNNLIFKGQVRSWQN